MKSFRLKTNVGIGRVAEDEEKSMKNYLLT